MHSQETSHRNVIGFKAPADLIARTEAAAKAEGVSMAAIARRALMRDLERRTEVQTETAA